MSEFKNYTKHSNIIFTGYNGGGSVFTRVNALISCRAIPNAEATARTPEVLNYNNYYLDFNSYH